MGVETASGVVAAARDLQQAEWRGWAERRFPSVEGRVSGRLPVVIKQSILNSIHRHGQERTDVEICGVLIGNGYRDAEGPFIYIDGAIRGDHAESQLAQVTFTAQTWNHIYAILDTAWPNHRILAWYHTHPGFGIFLSGMDLFIHENFFGAADQFALVYDPLAGEEGLFIWQNGEAKRGPFLVEPDEPPVPLKHGTARTGAAPEGTAEPSHAIVDDLLPRTVRIHTFAIIAVAILATVWPIVILLYVGRAQPVHGGQHTLEIEEPVNQVPRSHLPGIRRVRPHRSPDELSTDTPREMRTGDIAPSGSERESDSNRESRADGETKNE